MSADKESRTASGRPIVFCWRRQHGARASGETPAQHHHLVVRVAAQMPNEAMTEAQKKKKMEADRQKKNEQKELDNLNRVFEWCVRPTASACTLLSAHA